MQSRMRTCVLALLVVLLGWTDKAEAAIVNAGVCPAVVTIPTPAASSGKCATYSGTEFGAGKLLGFCNGIVDYPYFLPTGATQVNLEAAVVNGLAGGDPAKELLLSILPTKCQVQLKRVACMATFQACELVDPFYVDRTCLSEVCSPCGDVTVTPRRLLATGQVNPTYGSVCTNLTGNPGSNVASNCIVSPGKVPGLGNMGWELARTAFNGSAVPMEAFCNDRGLTWSEQFKSCMASVPRSACKSECDKLWNMNRTLNAGNNAMLYNYCPLISGAFSSLLTGGFAAYSGNDPNVAAQSAIALATATPTPIPAQPTVSVPLLGAFQLAPKCNGVIPSTTTALYGEVFSQETLLDRSAENLAVLIGGQRTKATFQVGASKCHCVVDKLSDTLQEQTNSVCNPDFVNNAYCDRLVATTSTCFANAAAAPPNSGIRFVGLNDDGMEDVCKQVVRHPANQPSQGQLTLMQLAFGLPSEDLARGAFFVPPSPGLPPLASGKMTGRPLCAIPNALANGEVYRGYDSYECAVAQVKSAFRVIPPLLSGSCRRTFLDMLCSQAHMKLEVKSMCLIPPALGVPCASTDVGGAAANTIPFVFALPRFANESTCTAFKTNCAGFLETLGPVGTDRRDRIESAFNCTGTITQTCARNNPLLADTWVGNTWSCDSGLNGRRSFPVARQVLADITTLLGPYVAAAGLDPLATALLGAGSTSSLTVAAASGAEALNTCECPYPLVVPDDPTAPTLRAGICCQQRCEGHMFPEEQFLTIITLQRVISVLSLVGTTFIIFTWGVFKVKRSQPLTFFFAVASFNVCLVFIVPNYSKPDVREVWCRDNTQPHVQADGGVCLFQSIWLPFWTISACCFWLVQGFDLYLRIVKSMRHLDHMTKYYHLFAWGVPSVITGVLLATQTLGYEQGQYWCFFRDVAENEDLGTGLDLGLFYGTIITIWSCGFVLMILVLYQIWKITSKTAGTAQTSNTLQRRLAMYRTPVFFVFFFVYVWVSIFGWRFDAEVKKPSIKEGAQDWIGCLLNNFGAGILDPAFNPNANTSVLQQKYGVAPGIGCQDKYPTGVAFGSILYLMCITGLQGVFIFVIFGAKVENLNLWKEKLGLTTKKYDTTADQDSSTKDKSGAKPSILSNAMSSLFAPSSPKASDSVEKDAGGGSAVMINGIQSGKFMAVDPTPVKGNQVAAAYMSE